MAKGNFPACLAVSLPHEGEWSDHRADPGGATMKGVTLGTFRKYYPGASKADLRKITDKQLQHIYQDGYWGPIKGELLPAGVDGCSLDYAINSGPGRANKELQRALGVEADGKVGTETLKAARAADGKTLIQKICRRRLSFMQGLPIWPTFKRGWSARVADVEARTVAMWLKAKRLSPAELDREAAKADNTAKNQTQGAAGTTVLGGGGGATDVFTSGDINWLLIGGIAAAAIVVVIFLVGRAKINRERAEAYARVAHA